MTNLSALPTVDLIGPMKRTDELQAGDVIVVRPWRQGVNRHIQRGRNGVRLGLTATVVSVEPTGYAQLSRVEVEVGQPKICNRHHEWETLHPDAVRSTEIEEGASF